jgi:hypothetical protein
LGCRTQKRLIVIDEFVASGVAAQINFDFTRGWRSKTSSSTVGSFKFITLRVLS